MEGCEYPINASFLPNKKKRPADVIRFAFGDGEPLAPTQAAIEAHRFSRTEARAVLARVNLLMPDAESPRDISRAWLLSSELELKVSP